MDDFGQTDGCPDDAEDATKVTKLTRRGFLVASAAATLSTVAVAAQKARWEWTQERDEAGRSVYFVTHVALGSAPATFSETTFGDFAKISIAPILNRDKSTNATGEIDFTLRVSGASLKPTSGDPSELFDLYVDFYHFSKNAAGAPSIDVRASGWVFGKRNGRPVLLAGEVAAAAWVSRERVEVSRKLSDLPARFLAALFDGVIVQPRRRATRLSFLPTLKPSAPFEWWFEVDGVAESDPRELFSVSVKKADTSASLESFARTSLVSGNVLRVWRDIAFDNGRGSFATGIKDEHDIENDRDGPAGLITHAELLNQKAASRRVVLAEHLPPKGSGAGIVCPTLQNFDVRSPTRLARFATREGGEVVTAEIDVNGQFVVVTAASRAGYDEALTEGPFPVTGLVRHTHHIGHNDLLLTCRLYINKGPLFSLFTSFGTFAAGAPEERRSNSTAKREPPPIRISTQSFTSIERFEVTTLIYDASITVPASTSQLPGDMSASEHFARLDFVGGTQITFRLHALGDAAASDASLGRIFLGYSSGMTASDDVVGPPCSIPMEQAHLRLIRTRDLAALKYRFAGLDLVTDGISSRLMPRGLAQVARVGGAGKATALSGLVHDPRPMMIVEFPPQHRAEESFFRLRENRPTPPKLPVAFHALDKIDEQLQVLHATFAIEGSDVAELSKKRVGARAAVLKALVKAAGTEDPPLYPELSKRLDEIADVLPIGIGEQVGPTRDELHTFLDFAEAYVVAVPPKGVNIPAEQRLYVGREFLDPEAALLAEMVQKARQSDALIGSDTNVLFDGLPADPVPAEERRAIAENYTQNASDAKKAELEQAIAEEIRRLRDAREPYFLKYKEVYDHLIGTLLAGRGALPAGFDDPTINIKTFEGRELIREAFLRLRRKADEAGTLPVLAKWMKEHYLPRLIAVRDDKRLPSDPTGNETPMRPVASRLSGPSRLAFRINTDDYETGAQGGAIPLTVDDLTNFSRFELQVVRRAQKLFRSNANGTRRPLWDLEEDQDLANMLVHQGFSRGGLSRLKLDEEDYLKDPQWENPDEERSWREERITVDERLQEVATFATARPTELETEIELPFRLSLSPSQDALFRTPREVPRELFGAALGGEAPKTRTIALWTAELDPESRANLRAIWSPDFRAEALLPQDATRTGFFFPKKKSRVNRTPLRGPYAPWAMGRHLSSADLSGAAAEMEGFHFRTSLDAFDRHELVTLSSVHGLPVTGRVAFDGSRIGKDQREPPPGFQVSLKGTPPSDVEAMDYNDVYVPKPLSPDGLELALSSLGGYLSVNASFEPPAAIVDHERGTLFDSLSIERWRHNIVLGRDITAELVYKGYLMPFGIRASLIKSTERVFEKVPGRNNPVAVLRQHMFIRIANPDKEFPAFRQPDEGRRDPFRKIKILTTQTPDIVDPYDLSGSRDQTGVWSGGLIDLQPRPEAGDIAGPTTAAPGTPFWPRTAGRSGAEVMFEILLDDTNKLRMPLVFVDNVTANNAASLSELGGYYNRLGDRAATGAYLAQSYLVQRPLFGQQIVFAPSLEEGDTRFETETLTFGVEGRRLAGSGPSSDVATYVPSSVNTYYASDAFMQGADQPPFYPVMHRASVRVAQIDRMTGRSGAPVTVGYDSTYAVRGFDPPNVKPEDAKNKRSIFLAFSAPVKMKFGNSGDRGGAVARPELNVVALSRTSGPIGSGTDGLPAGGNKTIASTAETPLTDGAEFLPIAHNIENFDLSKFFPGNAKILGLVSLKDAVELTLAGLGIDFEPKLQEIVEFGGGLADDGDAFIRTNVLLPLQAALASFRGRLSDIEFNGLSGEDALQSIYPDVNETMADFEDRIRVAIAAPPPSSGIEESIRAYSGVYASGRRFASAVELAARDPVTPVREAFRKSIEAYTEQLSVELTKTLDQIRALLATPNLRKRLIDFVKGELLTVSDDAAVSIAHLIFRIPSPSQPPDSSFEAEAAAALERSLAKAIRSDASWNADPSRGPIFSLEAFGKELEKALAVEWSNAPAGGFKDWLKLQEREVQDKLKGKIAEFEGRLWDAFDDVVLALSNAMMPVAEFTVDGIGDVVGKLEKAGAAIAGALDAMAVLRDIGDKFKAQCEAVVVTIDQFARTVLPIDAVSVDITACVAGTSFDWTSCQANPDVPRVYKAVGAVNRLAKGLPLLVSNGNGKLDRLIQSVENINDANVRVALQPLKNLRNKLRQPDFVGKITGGATRLNEAAVRIDVSAKAYLRRFAALQADLKSVCASPQRLFTDIVTPLLELDAQRQHAIASLTEISADITYIFGLVANDAIEAAPAPAAIVTVTSISPDPDADPATWQWDAANLSATEAVYRLETAKKDILGAILPPVRYIAGLLADLTSFAAFATQETDALRQQAKANLIVSLRDLAQKSGFAGLTNLAKRLERKAEADYPELTPVLVRLDDYVTRWNDNFGTLWQNLRDPEVPVSGIAELKGLFDIADKAGQKPLGDLVQDAVVGIAERHGRELLADLTKGYEARLWEFLSSTVAQGEEVYKAVLARIAPVLSDATGNAAKGFAAILAARNKVLTEIKDPAGGATAVAIASINQAMRLVLAACPADPTVPQIDLLQLQTARLNEISALFGISPEAAIEGLVELLTAWTNDANLSATACVPNDPNGPNAVIVILNQVKDAVDTLIRRDFARLIDIGLVKRVVEDKLKQLIPSRITLAYDLDVPLQPFAGIFIPAGPKAPSDLFAAGTPDSRLTLRARTIIDLLNPSPPKVDISGHLGTFAVKLIGDSFDVITLIFDGAKYGSETGGKLKTNITGVDLGEMVAFLDQFSQYFSFGGNGFFLAVRFDLPGIEAGYRMPPIYLTLGGLNIANLSLNASCILPFSDGEALFKVGLSRPESPFSITVGIFGGAGHLALYANAGGIIGFTASMEFGAIVDFRFGPLAGRGQVTAGIYIRSLKIGDTRVSTIEGVFTAGGSANIAMFRISAMLQVRVGQQPSGGVAGSAVFTFSFSLGIKDIEFRFVIFKQESKGYGGGGMSGGASASIDDFIPPKFDGSDHILVADNSLHLPTAAAIGKKKATWWGDYAKVENRGPVYEAESASQDTDFARYMTYFSEIEPWLPL